MAGEDTREAVISLPIDGQAVIERFESHERFSELFNISVVVICDDVVDLLPNLGAGVLIQVNRNGELQRVFHGRLFEADYLDQTTAGYRYHLTLRPWLFSLGQNVDYAIFQNQSALDIIKQVFETRGYNDIDYSKLSGSFVTREYTVQYRESDLAFVSRLMEEEGIYYFFRHEADRHILVLANARSSHTESGYGSLPFNPQGGGMALYQDHIEAWNERVASVARKQVSLRNWDFTRPAQPLQASYSGGDPIDAETVEVYDFPARFLDSGEGATRSQYILESARAERRAYYGQADALALACGDIVGLIDHPVDRLNQDYLLAGLWYAVESQQYVSGSGGGGDARASLEAIPADTAWRPAFLTPRPVARGPETAIVTGPSGEVIYTDEYGRVKVRFHWDRSGSSPENSTCFIRVSEGSAGDGFGHLALPRVGQEVIVDFLDGDPDRPIITGRVYNAQRMQTYDLPANKTRSLWRSQTVGDTGSDYDGAENPPSSGETGRHEIRMEDLSGQEELYIYAQRDRTTQVRRDDSFTLGRDQNRRVGRDRATVIKRNESFTVETGDETHQVSQGQRVTTIQKNESLTVSEGNMAIDVRQGNYSLDTDTGAITIQAAQSITLICGESTVKIDPTGVTVNGIMISMTAMATLSAEALETTLKGDSAMTIQGAVVNIN